MPRFECTVCEAGFDVPQESLDRFPGWEPKYCRTHSPTNKKKSKKKSASRRRGKSSGRDEKLTCAEVLAKYTEGERDGVFTDGSAIPNPGPGGWGVVWVADGEIVAQGHGSEGDTTNNRMELQALIEAYKLLPEDAEVTVHSDSRLCVDTITKWAPNWERNGWKKKGGEIKNLARVQELLRLYRAHPHARLKWIEAHAGHRWNEFADCLAGAWQRDEL
ncbi:MAG: ribonuclease HI [bacterium]|nr:ribonuclease HI [bacterium]